MGAGDDPASRILRLIAEERRREPRGLERWLERHADWRLELLEVCARRGLVPRPERAAEEAERLGRLARVLAREARRLWLSGRRDAARELLSERDRVLCVLACINLAYGKRLRGDALAYTVSALQELEAKHFKGSRMLSTKHLEQLVEDLLEGGDPIVVASVLREG